MKDKTYELIEKLYMEMQKGFNETNNRIDAIEKTVIKIEHDHGEKLDILFDGQQAINEKLEEHTLRLDRIESKLGTHDIQIHVLDKTKADAK